MNMPVNTVQKSSVHPLIIAAAVAIVLFCGVGAAAIVGWLPSSVGSNSPTNPNSNASIGVDQPAQVSKSVPQVRPANEAVHRARVQHNAGPAYSVSAAPTICADCGVIEAVREIETRGQGSGVGAAGGAVLGGLLGHEVGGGRGRELATIAGVIGGAMAGNHIEGNVKTNRSYDITVRMNGGSIRTFHQTEKPDWRSGDHVKIVDGMLRANG